MKSIKLAAFGFRSIPPNEGSAGADKFAMELYPRLVKKGFIVHAYNRIYSNQQKRIYHYQGVNIINIKTVSLSGFDTLLHSCISTFHILYYNTGDIVHIHNGGNSIFGLILRLFGKKVIVSQDGVDWKREKWNWYAKLYLYLSYYISAWVTNDIIFDNIYSKELFENKFRKKYSFIPYGSEVQITEKNSSILEKNNLTPQGYFLFVGRFIPDKGLHYLIKAFENIVTDKKLVLVGGSPNPSEYEFQIKNTKDSRIIFPGYVYGDDTIHLMKNAYAYIQPSDVEGLSPVILTIMGLGTPLICSNIKENIYAVRDTAITFEKGDSFDLSNKIKMALSDNKLIKELSEKALHRAKLEFGWDKVVDDHVKVFQKL